MPHETEKRKQEHLQEATKADTDVTERSVVSESRMPVKRPDMESDPQFVHDPIRHGMDSLSGKLRRGFRTGV